MKKIFLNLVGILLFTSGLLAQEESVMDSVMLNEITTTAISKKYQAGVKIESISPDQLKMSQVGGIDQILMRFTPIYLKSNAGGLSTIHLRGTSANHTSVNFGGINVNSLTLGHSDMTSIPSFLFDEIDLQYGSSSAINGSGSIGGSLHLGLKSNWTDGVNIKANITEGSFGEQFYGAKVFAGNGHFESVSRLFYFSKTNDFPFKNPYTGNVEDRRPVDDRQQGANMENLGLIQEFNYRFSIEEYIKSAFWVAHDWHQIQPNMQTNLNYKTTEDLDNKHLRFWTNYQNNRHSVKFRGALGFVRDMQVYNKDEFQKIGTSRSLIELEIKQDLSAKYGYKAGIKSQYIVPDVYSYDKSVVKYEHHFESYFSSFFSYRNRMKMTLNMRQMFVSNFTIPFTPSVGAEYCLLKAEKQVLKLSLNVASSFRVPTFNDRYWGNQGNPNLKPEDGMNYEFGLNYSYQSGDFKTKLKVNGFYMDVKNWIEWRNFGVWQAQNVKEVVSKGIELQTNTNYTFRNIKFNLIANYNYNPVESIHDVSESGIVGQQLIYTPRHMGNASLITTYNLWQLYVDGTYTGSRLADDFGTLLDPYILVNSGITRKISLYKKPVTVCLNVNNLLDTNYQNQRYYAMPGRSFRISLSTNLNFK